MWVVGWWVDNGIITRNSYLSLFGGVFYGDMMGDVIVMVDSR